MSVNCFEGINRGMLCPLIGQWRALANQRRSFVNEQILINKRVHWPIFRSLTNHLVYCQINVFIIVVFILQKSRMRIKTKKNWKLCDTCSFKFIEICQLQNIKNFITIFIFSFIIKTKQSNVKSIFDNRKFCDDWFHVSTMKHALCNCINITEISLQKKKFRYTISTKNLRTNC